MRKLFAKKVTLSIAVALFVAIGAAILFACSQTPTPIPLRTFERAQRLDVVCLKLFDDAGNPIVPEGLPQENCAPVPSDVNGGGMQNQLFALVTQTSRGEVAVVDLSAGFIVDQRRSIPGTNFLPVGSVPTDVATAPDGKMAFVASAEPNKAAIYGISTRRILGDIQGRPADPDGPITLASWPVCALPQNPGALTVVPRRGGAVTADGGAGDAGAADGGDAGAPAADEPDYVLVAVLPGDRRSSAKVVSIDPRPFLRGANVLPPSTGPVLAPGSLAPCPIIPGSAVELAGSEAVPGAFHEGPAWSDGVVYLDGGVDLDCKGPPRASTCAVPCKCVSDGGTPAPEAGAPDASATCENGPADGGAIPLPFGPLDPPRLTALARDDQTVFIADEALPLIHVVDFSTGSPVELPPYVATSVVDPGRVVAIRALAVSPSTRDYQRFMYAIDREQGSVMVFDVTDVATAPRTPMIRPHAELDPFEPPDRIAFPSPAVAVAFARYDFPLSRIGDTPIPNARSGLLCNPSPAITVDNAQQLGQFGFYYRADRGEQPVGLGPPRLRGVFAMATLSDGRIFTVDVDDWDAPCRRPFDMTDAGAVPTTSALAAPEPAPSDPNDFDPYHVPTAAPNSVTDEVFFPVSAPHRMRSAVIMRDDPTTGRHIPFLAAAPTIQKAGTPLPLVGDKSEQTPRLHPTGPGGDPTSNDVRFSFEVPNAHIDQDWSVTYEGPLPGFDGLPATLSTDDGDQSVLLRQPQARFCAKGVEDWEVSTARANQIAAALDALKRPAYPERIDRRMTDYVQVMDDVLPGDDPYWTLPDEGQCWDPRLSTPQARHDACVNAYGETATGVDQSFERDFPILEAYDDHLVLGRFATLSGNTTREVVFKDPSNAATLKLMRCCFHHQITFRVRTGSQWVTTGTVVGFLNHMSRGAGGRCVPSCEDKDKLRNGRVPALPFDPSATPAVPDRDSVLALRNPSFSFFIADGQLAGKDKIPERDTVWQFSSRGQFIPLFINLASQTFDVNPQSMRFIETLGQVAVVDAASQGLVLIDLRSVSLARAPYF